MMAIAVMWWAACSHLPVLPQPAGRLFIFAGLRAPYLWMFPWGQLFGANSAARANYLQTRREPTIWSQGQHRHPRQPFGDRSRANYLEPTLPPAPHMWSHARLGKATLRAFGFRWVQTEGLNCHPPACYGPPSERDSLAAPEARRRCCGPVGPRTTNWGALCLRARHGGPCSKSSRSYLFLQKRSNMENTIPNMCFFCKFHLF